MVSAWQRSRCIKPDPKREGVVTVKSRRWTIVSRYVPGIKNGRPRGCAIPIPVDASQSDWNIVGVSIGSEPEVNLIIIVEADISGASNCFRPVPVHWSRCPITCSYGHDIAVWDCLVCGI